MANPHTKSLTDRTARGVAWMVVQTVGTQVVNLGGFLILGWLLDNTAFGLFALVTTVSTLVAISKQFGLNTVIIHRFSRFGIYCNPAMWMSAALGVVAMLIMCAAAPFAALIYDQPELTGLILVFALGVLPDALSGVPEAALAARMRFKLLAAVQFLWMSLLMILMVIFALLDFGPYSFVLPQPIVQMLRLALVWSAARPRLRRSPQLRRWRYLFGDSLTLSIGRLANWVMNQADYVILGLLHPEAIVGLYFFGFRVGTRVVVLFMQSLRTVLMPAFSDIRNDPQRQFNAYMRANTMLAILTAPICALQVLLAEPFFSTFLPADKHPAAAVVQIMAVASFFRVVREPAAALIQAQGRFQTTMILAIALAIAFVVAVIIGASLGQEKAVAAFVSAHATLGAFAFATIAVRHSSSPLFWTTAQFIGTPIIVAATLLVGAYSILGILSMVQNLLASFIGAAALIAAYAIIMRALSPLACGELMLLVRERLART